MKWSVSYSIWYPDIVRHGRTECANRQAAFEWVEYAKVNRNFLEVNVWFLTKLIHRWRMNEVHTEVGEKHKFIVYKPSTGTKYYVRKVSLANGKQIGKDTSHANEYMAKQIAGTRAREDRLPRKGFV